MKIKRNITILLTGVGGPGAPGIIHCYKSNGERNIRIIGVDMDPNAAGKGLVDVFYSVPRAKDPNFIPCLLDICKKEHVDIAVPMVTKELESFSINRAQFESIGTKVSALSPSSLFTVNDKGRLFDSLTQKGIPTAKYKIVSTSDELFRTIDDFDYPNIPLCIKVTNGNGSRGIRILDFPENDYYRFFNEKPNSQFISYEYLKHALSGKTIPPLIVMEYLPGAEYSVDIVADETGILAMVCRRGLKVVSSIQTECVIEHNEAVESLCRQITDEFHLVGQFGFDLKCNSEGVPFVLEINPRLTAGIVACAAAGCNLPYYELLRILGEDIPSTPPQYGTIMTRRWKEIFFDSQGNELDF